MSFYNIRFGLKATVIMFVSLIAYGYGYDAAALLINLWGGILLGSTLPAYKEIARLHKILEWAHAAIDPDTEACKLIQEEFDNCDNPCCKE